MLDYVLQTRITTTSHKAQSALALKHLKYSARESGTGPLAIHPLASEHVSQHHILKDASVCIAIKLVLISHHILDESLPLLHALGGSPRRWLAFELDLIIGRPQQVLDEPEWSAVRLADTATYAYLGTDKL